ncbi:hypothetical protein [Granulicella arctica]|uniref:hypothetical protein n=1 Tax=Granulicella arctica TaxID=940613 RepID=UPI0021E0B83A|nr:hypothetical protein [Granulicella arctica]
MTNPPTPPPPNYEQVIVPPVQQPAGAYPPAPSNVYAQPGYPQPGYPPRSNNTALKVILIVVGILALFGILAAAVIGFGAYKLSKAVHKNANGDVSFSTPAGTFSTGDASSVTQADLAIPEYPNSERSTGSMKMKTPGGSLVTATYNTPDAPDKVIAFYKDKLGDQATVTERGSSTVITVGESSSEKKVITIRPQGDITKITMLHSQSLR